MTKLLSSQIYSIKSTSLWVCTHHLFLLLQIHIVIELCHLNPKLVCISNDDIIDNKARQHALHIHVWYHREHGGIWILLIWSEDHTLLYDRRADNFRFFWGIRVCGIYRNQNCCLVINFKLFDSVDQISVWTRERQRCIPVQTKKGGRMCKMWTHLSTIIDVKSSLYCTDTHPHWIVLHLPIFLAVYYSTYCTVGNFRGFNFCGLESSRRFCGFIFLWCTYSNQ